MRMTPELPRKPENQPFPLSKCHRAPCSTFRKTLLPPLEASPLPASGAKTPRSISLSAVVSAFVSFQRSTASSGRGKVSLRCGVTRCPTKLPWTPRRTPPLRWGTRPPWGRTRPPRAFYLRISPRPRRGLHPLPQRPPRPPKSPSSPRRTRARPVAAATATEAVTKATSAATAAAAAAMAATKTAVA